MPFQMESSAMQRAIPFVGTTAFISPARGHKESTPAREVQRTAIEQTRKGFCVTNFNALDGDECRSRLDALKSEAERLPKDLLALSGRARTLKTRLVP